MKRSSNLVILTAILFIWAGMIIAISFIEAPLKFQAPNITIALGLGIGRLVFNALNKVEILFTLFSLFLIYKISTTKIAVPILIIATVIAIQTFILLPMLDLRAIGIIEGKSISKNSPHWYYVALEMIKLVILIITGTFSAKELTIKQHD